MNRILWAISAIIFVLILPGGRSVYAQGGMENAEEFQQKVVERVEDESSKRPVSGSDYIELQDSSDQNNADSSSSVVRTN